jgi:hypothetical protein
MSQRTVEKILDDLLRHDTPCHLVVSEIRGEEARHFGHSFRHISIAQILQPLLIESVLRRSSWSEAFLQKVLTLVKDLAICSSQHNMRKCVTYWL